MIGHATATGRDRAVCGPVPRWVVVTAIAVTILLGLGAFGLSFTALADLAEPAGIEGGQAWVWPLIVGGIIVVATISVVVLAPLGARATWYPGALLVAGAAVSGNAAHAEVAADNVLPSGWAAVSAVAPLVLLATTHLTVELASRTRRRPTIEPSTDASAASQAVAVNGTSRRQRRETAWEGRQARWSYTQIARHLGVHPCTVGRWFADPPSDVATSPERASSEVPPAATGLSSIPPTTQGAAHDR